jgi:predicted lipoprotein with Yx(FWY)xxD motif
MVRIRHLAVSLLFLAFAALVPAVATSAASTHQSTAGLVNVAKVGKLGSILVTSKGFALYQWTQEKKHQIKCTSACATAWPPLLVPAHATLAKHIRGAMGTFGVIMRPDGTHQLTYQGKALYRYQGDTKPGEALCQGSEGWYVFSAH